MMGTFLQRIDVFGMRGWRVAAAVCALAVFVLVLMVAGRGLASGAQGDVLNVRFGGDAERTRVVVDLERNARGRVSEEGRTGRVVLDLAGVAAGRGVTGSGSGLVRRFAVSNDGGGSRLSLETSRAVEIERRFILPPGDGIGHYRYVVDLKATGPATAQPRVAEPRAEPRRERPLIYIDAGHGGRDPGAHGGETQEKAVTLAAARALKAELERRGGYRVQMTRDSDVYIGLERRVQIARNAGADLFISLHADAGGDAATRGASVYTLSDQGASRAVRAVMSQDDWHREMGLPGQDPSVDRILLDLTQRATQNRSAQFARLLLGELEDSGQAMLRRSHRDAGFAVLLAPDVPAVLLEMGFITNPEDERALTDERRRREMMRAVADGIEAYFRAPQEAMIAATRAAGSNGAP